MPANTLYIDDRKRAHLLVVPPPPYYGPSTFRERPFTIVSLGMSVGQPIWTDDRKNGPLLRARGCFLERALRFVDVPTLAADLDAVVVEARAAFEAAVETAKAKYEAEQSARAQKTSVVNRGVKGFRGAIRLARASA